MNIHEYQAKMILETLGLPLLPRGIATTPAEAVSVAQKLGTAPWVVKAQIHAGGRGKAGGVKLCKTLEEVKSVSESLLGKALVTHQTGPQGRLVRTIMVEKGTSIAREFYLAFTLDRFRQSVSILVSAEGGMEIEELAAQRPEALLTIPIDPLVGVLPFYARRVTHFLGLTAKDYPKILQILEGLYRVFTQHDASLVEINPLIQTQEGELILLDAKMTFDDNGLFRQKVVAGLRDIHEEDPTEVEASGYGLSFIKLDGNIGCLVNGAGLAMATLDIIKHYGATPANFLDVGGGADQAKVTAAFRMILKDPAVKAILVNIFGGIMKCDVIAQGVVAASKEVGLKVPLVVRLAGTNVELGRRILEESGLPITAAKDLDDAAQKVVGFVK